MTSIISPTAFASQLAKQAQLNLGRAVDLVGTSPFAPRIPEDKSAASFAKDAIVGITGALGMGSDLTLDVREALTAARTQAQVGVDLLTLPHGRRPTADEITGAFHGAIEHLGTAIDLLSQGYMTRPPVTVLPDSALVTA